MADITDICSKYLLEEMGMQKWIAVDLDGTLAQYNHYIAGHIGDPVPAMQKRVMDWIAKGERVKIFTARAYTPLEIPLVERWLKTHGFPELEVTNIKDYLMKELWDDRAVRVPKNTGEPCCDEWKDWDSEPDAIVDSQ